MQDIAQDVSEAVARSGIQTRMVHLFNIGSTRTLGCIEFEPGLEADFPEMLDRLIPPSKEGVWHGADVA